MSNNSINNLFNDGEHVEDLGEGFRLIVSKSHTFGTDALLLASFSFPKRDETVIDLGAGCGIIPFYWLKGGCKGLVYGVDIQSEAVDLMQRSLSMNPLIQNFTPILADLRELQDILPAGKFDTVVMNPPYTPKGAGILSAKCADQIARHGTNCSFSELCFSAQRLLRFGGKLSVCLRPERLCDMIDAMRENKIEPKRMRFVSKNPVSVPWLVLVEGRRGGKSGLCVLSPLFIESEEMKEIVGSYKKTDGEESK